MNFPVSENSSLAAEPCSNYFFKTRGRLGLSLGFVGIEERNVPAFLEFEIKFNPLLFIVENRTSVLI